MVFLTPHPHPLGAVNAVPPGGAMVLLDLLSLPDLWRSLDLLDLPDLLDVIGSLGFLGFIWIYRI